MDDLTGLVERARAGDADAFRALVERCGRTAHAYATSLLRDPDLAQDAVQEAFAAAHAGLPRLDDPAKFPGWLRAVTHHQCYRVLRRRRFDALALEAAAGVPSAEEGPAFAAERRERRAGVLDALAALPAGERAVVALHYFDGLSHAEIARFLGVPAATVNNRLHAARTKLKHRMVNEMAKEFEQHGLPQDFAERVGRVVQVRGPVVEVDLAPGAMPGVLEALPASDERLVTVEVVRDRDRPRVRCIATATPTGLRQGAAVGVTGAPASTPVGAPALGRAVQVLRRPVASRAAARDDAKRVTGPGPQALATDGDLLETGIKAVDLLAPLQRGGTVGIFGGAGVGQLVLVEELIRRLGSEQSGVSLFTLVQPGRVEEFRGFDIPKLPDDGALQSFYVPSDAAKDTTTFAAREAAFDAALYLARDLALCGLYPAIDPVLSSSRAPMADEHAELARRARELLWDTRAFQSPGADLSKLKDEHAATVRRGRRLHRFLTQPFFVAEPYTKRPGEVVPLAETLRGVAAILDGELDDVPEDDLYMKGGLAS